LGSYVTDLAFRTPKLPAWGETCLGNSFHMGPGGKGSNQAVAAARAGARVRLMSKVGDDEFGDMARAMWKSEGIDASYVSSTATATGAAAIILDQGSGENAIVVAPGACYEVSSDEVHNATGFFERASVLLAQLELPVDAVGSGHSQAQSQRAITVLNPAPARPDLPGYILADWTFLTPNETEAEVLTGIGVDSLADAERAADVLLSRGNRAVVITLGARGALLKTASTTHHVPAFDTGRVVDTTGAGDAFNGAFAAALAEGMDAIAAVRFGCAAGALSVTRPGTAPSMPYRAEIDELLAR
jgi:ribokinase